MENKDFERELVICEGTSAASTYKPHTIKKVNTKKVLNALVKSDEHKELAKKCYENYRTNLLSCDGFKVKYPTIQRFFEDTYFKVLKEQIEYVLDSLGAKECNIGIANFTSEDNVRPPYYMKGYIAIIGVAYVDERNNSCLEFLSVNSLEG